MCGEPRRVDRRLLPQGESLGIRTEVRVFRLETCPPSTLNTTRSDRNHDQRKANTADVHRRTSCRSSQISRKRLAASFSKHLSNAAELPDRRTGPVASSVGTHTFRLANDRDRGQNGTAPIIEPTAELSCFCRFSQSGVLIEERDTPHVCLLIPGLSHPVARAMKGLTAQKDGSLGSPCQLGWLQPATSGM